MLKGYMDKIGKTLKSANSYLYYRLYNIIEKAKYDKENIDELELRKIINK